MNSIGEIYNVKIHVFRYSVVQLNSKEITPNCIQN